MESGMRYAGSRIMVVWCLSYSESFLEMGEGSVASESWDMRRWPRTPSPKEIYVLLVNSFFSALHKTPNLPIWWTVTYRQQAASWNMNCLRILSSNIS